MTMPVDGVATHDALAVVLAKQPAGVALLDDGSRQLVRQHNYMYRVNGSLTSRVAEAAKLLAIVCRRQKSKVLHCLLLEC